MYHCYLFLLLFILLSVPIGKQRIRAGALLTWSVTGTQIGSLGTSGQHLSTRQGS